MEKKKKKKETLEIGMDGLRGSKEAMVEDQKLPEAMELRPEFKDQMHQEIENIGVIIGRRVVDQLTKESGTVH